MILENDCVWGTFTHRREPYLPLLEASVKKHLPHIPFIAKVQDAPINRGMYILRQAFIESGKRFHIYMDDDIQVLDSDIIRNALETLVNGKYGLVGVYSTFDTNALTEPYDPVSKGITRREYNGFIPGYFICVDAEKVGDCVPDLELIYPNTAVDTSYCCSVRAKGYSIGIADSYVYHQKKNTPVNGNEIDATNQYLMKKWGKFYFDWSVYAGCVID